MMPSNDEVILDIPNARCPSCDFVLDMSARRIDKYTQAQRKRMNNQANQSTTLSYRTPAPEDVPSDFPEKNFIVVTCSNFHCEQYNKIKVLQIPRLHTPSAKVEL
jgi:hypothetical protein